MEAPNTTSLDPNYPLQRWMSKLKPETRLRSLILPGTHDSNTNDLIRPWYALPFAITQKLTLTEQLKRGVRYLDIRFTGAAKAQTKRFEKNVDLENRNWDKICEQASQTILTGHGITSGKPLFPVLKEVADFVKENPTEFVVVKMQQEKTTLTPLQKRALVEFIRLNFASNLITDLDLNIWFQLPNTEIGKVWEHQKNVLVLMRREIFENIYLDDSPGIQDGLLVSVEPRPPLPSIGIQYPNWEEIGTAVNYLEEVGVFDKDRFVCSPWFNTDKFEHLKEGLLNLQSKSVPDRFKVYQMIFTPQKGVMKFIFERPSIYRLEKLQFEKYSQAANLIVKFIIRGSDLNIGVSVIFYFLIYFFIYGDFILYLNFRG